MPVLWMEEDHDDEAIKLLLSGWNECMVSVLQRMRCKSRSRRIECSHCQMEQEGERMKMRIMGTEEECAAMVNLIRSTVPKEYIKSISNFYPNRRQTFSNEGRVYCEFSDLIQQMPGLVVR